MGPSSQAPLSPATCTPGGVPRRTDVVGEPDPAMHSGHTAPRNSGIATCQGTSSPTASTKSTQAREPGHSSRAPQLPATCMSRDMPPCVVEECTNVTGLARSNNKQRPKGGASPMGPAIPSQVELMEEQMDKHGESKQTGAEAREDAKVQNSLDNFTEAVKICKVVCAKATGNTGMVFSKIAGVWVPAIITSRQGKPGSVEERIVVQYDVEGVGTYEKKMRADTTLFRFDERKASKVELTDAQMDKQRESQQAAAEVRKAVKIDNAMHAKTTGETGMLFSKTAGVWVPAIITSREGKPGSVEERIVVQYDVEGVGTCEKKVKPEPEFFKETRVSELRPKDATTGFCIAKTEDRAITLVQLQRLVDYIKGHCEAEGWTSCNPLTPGLKLNPQSIDLYNVVFWVVKPATKKENCSYVELVASSAQEPTWFVSHWWGEPVLRFVACLRSHTRDRKLPRTACYWVCAYANNQWQAGDEVGDNPEQSSFRKAIDKSVGTVTVLDDTARTYTRIWCSYEIFVTLTTKRADTKYLYDVYTATDNGSDAVGLTDGVAAVDRQSFTLGHQAQTSREENFPNNLMLKGLESDVTRAEASNKFDRIHILNAVAGNSVLNATPPENHENYDVLNGRLRTFFATRTLRTIDQEDIGAKCAEALRQSRSGEMTLDLSHAKEEKVVLGVVRNGLPASLRTLSITWRDSKVGPALGTGIASAIRNLNGLTTLDLCLRSSKIGAEGAIALAKTLGSLEHLEKVKLLLDACGLGYEGALSIWSSLGRVDGLQEVVLDLTNNGLEDWIERGLSHGSLQGLARGNAELEEEELVFGVVRSGLPVSLRALSITWEDSESGPVLGTGIASAIHTLNGLTTLNLYLNRSQLGAEGAISLGDSFDSLRRLEKFRLYVDECGIGNAGALGLLSSLGRLEGLTELALSMDENDLDDEIVPSVEHAIRAMPLLQEVVLQVRYNNFGDSGEQALKGLRQQLTARPQPPHIDDEIGWLI